MKEELCNQCGAENCSGHKCDACGRNADYPISVDSKFYCDKYCLYSKQPDHPSLSTLDSKRADILTRMRALRQEAQEAGVAWIS